MNKSETAYAKVQAELKKNPDMTITAACKKLRVSPHSYSYAQWSRSKKARAAAPVIAKASKVTYKKLKAPVAPKPDSNERLVCVIGSPEQIRAFMAGGI